MRVLLDTNVVVDVLQRREPWFQAGDAIFHAVANRRIRGFLTAKQIADLHYFSKKQFRGMDNVDERARQVIGKLLSLFEIVDVLGMDCQNALGLENGDYEDAVLIECAARAGMTCIVTRNTDHFRPSPVPVYAPDALVDLISQPE